VINTSAIDRRWREFYEKPLPTKEIEKRRQMVKNVIKIGVSTSLMIMIFGTIIVAKIAIQYTKMEAVYITLFGMLIVVSVGLYTAYSYGEKMGKIYGRYMENYNKQNM
jgi:hypothetical protein